MAYAENRYPMATRADDWRAVASESLTAAAAAAVPYAIASLRPPGTLRGAIDRLNLVRRGSPTPFKIFFILVNASQILLCARVVFLIFDSGWISGFKFHCQPSDGSEVSIESISASKACWYYLLTNIVAILDTVYLRLYGKEVTYLHVYHHSSALVWSWVVAKLVPGGRSFFSVLGISITHVAIYFYYLITLIGIPFNRYACWVPLTLVQTVLIAVGIVHMSAVFQNGCQYPKTVAVIYIVCSSILLCLFLELLFKSYKKKIS